MISYAHQNPEEQPDVTTSPADDYIAPAPRVSVQAYCETVETAAAVRSAAGGPRPRPPALAVVTAGPRAPPRGLPHCAYSERDHPGNRGPQRYPCRPR